MITVNQIFTRVYRALNPLDESFTTYVTRTYDAIVPDLPCVYFRETHFRPSNHVTLEYSDKQIDSTVYLEVFAKEDIDTRINAIEEVMNDMRYIEESCVQIDNADISIERYAMTFTRIICEGDTL